MTGAELVQKIEDAIEVNGPLFRGATVWHRWEEIKEALIAVDAAREDARDAACPDDIRAAGWAVAVHNDYRQGGEPHTFWLFTKDGCAVKGEGRTDAEALAQVRAVIDAAMGGNDA